MAWQLDIRLYRNEIYMLHTHLKIIEKQMI